MDGIFHGCPVLLQFVRQLTHQMLRLRQRHAVTGNDDHRFCTLQHLASRAFFYGSLWFICFFFYENLFLSRFFPRIGSFPGQDIRQAPVHGSAHDLCEEQPGCANDSADRYQQDIADRHTGNGSCNSAQRVEQRDGDGHVGSAHPDGEGISEKCAHGDAQSQNQPDVERWRKDGMDETGINDQTGQSDDARVQDRCMVFPDDRSLRQKFVQLSCGDQASHQCNNSHDDSQYGGDVGENDVSAIDHPDSRKCESSNQCRRQSADPVEQRHQLRHLDHLDPNGECAADDCSHKDININARHGNDAVEQQGCNDSRQNACGTDDVAHNGGFHLAHHRYADQDHHRQYGT